MSAKKTKKTREAPKSDAEVLKSVRRIIADWHLAKGAGCDNGERKLWFLEKDETIDRRNSDKYYTLPDTYAALERIEEALGLKPMTSNQEQERFLRWIRPKVRPLTAEEMVYEGWDVNHGIKRRSRSPRP